MINYLLKNFGLSALGLFILAAAATMAQGLSASREVIAKHARCEALYAALLPASKLLPKEREP